MYVLINSELVQINFSDADRLKIVA